MTRKMAWIGSFYLIGLFAASYFNSRISSAAAAVLLLSAVSAFVVYKGRYAKAAVCLISAACGLFCYVLYDVNVYRNIIKYDGSDVIIEGTVLDLSEHSGDKTSYMVKGVINGDVTATVTCYTDSTDARIGDYVTLVGKAAELTDSYKFPTKTYYKAKGIYLRVNNATAFDCTPRDFSLRRTVDTYREYILEVLYQNMDRDCAAVMQAMLFGDKSAIDSDEKTLMYRAGIGHIMAVSGVHLSVVCSMFWYVLSRLPLNKYVRFGLLLLPMGCFAFLAGFSNSVLRAALMLSLVYGAELFRRCADTFNSLGIAVILLTVASPFAVRDASFLLSVAGVFGIGVAAPCITDEIESSRKLNSVVKAFISSFCVTALVFPATFLFFDEVSVMSPLSNLLLLPLCELVLICGVIVMLTGGWHIIAVPVLKVCDVCCRFVIFISELIGRLRFSYIPLGSGYALAAIIIALAASALMLFIMKNKSRAALMSVAVFAAATSFVSVYRHIPDGTVTVAVLKEGSAVTAIVHNKQTASVVDLSSGGRAMASVKKYLNRNGIYNIEAAVLNTDAHISLLAYSKAENLYNIAAVLIPESNSLTAEGFDRDILFYGDNGCVDLSSCTLSFTADGKVTVSSMGTDIIMYGSGSEIDETVSYGGAVRYSGAKRDSDADAAILAVMNDRASAVCRKGEKVYIGENVKFILNKDGTVTSEAIG